MLRKRRVEMRGVEVEVEGDQADEAPWPYERIALHFLVRCDRLTVPALERVIRLSVVRYCGVLATVSGVATIEASLELVDLAGASSGRKDVPLDVAAAEAPEPPPADDEAT
jgi:putative redox protein